MSTTPSTEARCPCGKTRLSWSWGFVSVSCTCPNCGKAVELVSSGPRDGGTDA